MVFKADGKAILIAFIGAIIATTLIVSISDQTTLMTSDRKINNGTVTALAVNTSLDLTGRDLVGTPVTGNASVAGNLQNNGVTIAEGFTSGGLRSVQLTLNDTAAAYVGKSINTTYSYRPDGHVGTGTGAISITQLIVLFSAIGVMIFVVVMFIREGTLGKLIRGGK